jgi:hypothetical protein
MRTKFHNIHARLKQSGSVMMVTLLLCVILGLLMGSYLSMVQTQNLSVARGQCWNSAIVVAEAGVEEAMAHINALGITTNNLALNNWKKTGPVGIYVKSNFLGSSYYSTTIIVTNNNPPVILSKGYVLAPISNSKIMRTVQVTTIPKTGLNSPGAMVVSTSVNFNGFNISTDSFDSSNTNYSTAGLYDPKKAEDHGDVVTLSGGTNALDVGNGKIKGTVHTAPGGVPKIGAGGSVGDSAWVDGGKTGFETNHFKDDVNYTFPDAVLPPAAYWLAPVPGSYKINGVTYKYVLNNTNPWKLDSLDGSVYINGSDVVLYVTDSISLGSKMEIRIAASSSFQLYMAGATANISGAGIINESGIPKNFVYWGLPSNTALTFGANVGFVGTIYAPQAVFTLGGGGKNAYDFIGASITKSATMNGHYNFHYDEGLPKQMPANGYLAKSWAEL